MVALGRITQIRTFAALQEPGFGWLTLGLVCSFMGMSIQNLARAYLAFQLTGSGAAIGAVMAAWGLPMIFLTMIAGVVSDRVSKKTVLMYTQSTLGLSALATGLLVQAGVVELWHLVALGLVQGCAFGFNLPTRQAIIPEMVRRERLANAVALTNGCSSSANIAGPPIAGFLISIPIIGINGAMYLSAFCYLIVLFMFHNLPERPASAAVPRSFGVEFKAGFNYVRRSAHLPILLTMGYVPWLIAQPYQYALPVYSEKVMNAGAQGLGILMGAVGLGALTGSLTTASLASTRWKNRIQLAAGFSFAFALIAFGFAPAFWLAVVCLFFAGGSASTYMALNQASIMNATEPGYFGRVMSVASLVSALGPLSVLPYGMVVDAIGPRETVIGSAVIVVLFLLGVAMFRPSMRRVDPDSMLTGPTVAPAPEPALQPEASRT